VTCAAAPAAAPPVPLVSRLVALHPHANSTDHRPILHDLDVITAVHGIRSGQATYVAKILDRNFRSKLGWDGILSMVLLLMDQRRGPFRVSSPGIARPRYMLS